MIEGVGNPVVITVKVSLVPTTKLVDPALVMPGAVGTFSVKVIDTEPSVATTLVELVEVADGA